MQLAAQIVNVNEYDLKAPPDDFVAAIGALADRTERAGHVGVLEYRFYVDATAETAGAVIVYADSETEPASRRKHGDWPEPHGDSKRHYLVSQTEAYAQNLRVIEAREPHFIAIAGDLVESGGEQRDWDEFWRHNAGELGNVASTVPSALVAYSRMP